MPQRSKRRIIFVLSLWILLLVVIVGIVTPVRDIVLTHLFPAAGTPTATIPAGDDLFYIQDFPRGTISIDGHLIAHLPDMNKQPHPDAPLRLARGKHQIVWESVPFKPVVCALSVPSQIDNEPCNNNTVIQNSAGQNIHLITFTATYSDLPSTQQTALQQHIQGGSGCIAVYGYRATWRTVPLYLTDRFNLTRGSHATTESNLVLSFRYQPHIQQKLCGWLW